MTGEAPKRGRMLERPGRVAAVGGAAVICLLTVSSALGISNNGHDAGAPNQPAAALSDPSPAGSGSDAAVGAGGGAGDSAGTAENQAPQHPGGSDTKTEHHTSPPQQSTALPARSGTGRRVVFDVSAQRVWLVNADNSVARTYPVSGSKYDNLDNGTYSVYSRDRYATAYNSDETMDYMVRFTTSNKSSTPIGFHSIPRMPDGSLAEPRAGLGAPASDGCIRQWISDARALWDFADDGTTVVVRA